MVICWNAWRVLCTWAVPIRHQRRIALASSFITEHQDPVIQGTCSLHPSVCSRDMNCAWWKMPGYLRAFTWNVSIRYSASDGRITSVMSTLQTRLVSFQSWIILTNVTSIFHHAARMLCTVPVYQALRCQIDLSLGHLPDWSWKRRPGHPLKHLDHIRDSSQHPPADVWKDAVRCGHQGTMQQSLTTTC